MRGPASLLRKTQIWPLINRLITEKTIVTLKFPPFEYWTIPVFRSPLYRAFLSGIFQKVTALKSDETKVMLSVGGPDANDTLFSTLVNNVTLRANFVKHSVQYLKENNFDGLVSQRSKYPNFCICLVSYLWRTIGNGWHQNQEAKLKIVGGVIPRSNQQHL